jgi:cation transporter-like permease
VTLPAAFQENLGALLVGELLAGFVLESVRHCLASTIAFSIFRLSLEDSSEL